MKWIVWNGHSVVLMFNEFGSTKELLQSWVAIKTGNDGGG
jgi:hypothetical protein